VVPAPVASQVSLDSDSAGFTARITEVSAIYGNVFLNLQPADFTTVGIKPKLIFNSPPTAASDRVFYGADFNDVPRGDWVAFPNADGFFWLSRNWENAAATAGLNSETPSPSAGSPRRPPRRRTRPSPHRSRAHRSA